MLTFTYAGNEYCLDFRRDHKRVRVLDKLASSKVWRWETSRHPYTTVYLSLIEKEIPSKFWVVKHQAEVGVSQEDVYSHEMGRIYALRKLTPFLPKEMRRAMWECYMGRKPKRRKGTPPPTPPSAASALGLGVLAGEILENEESGVTLLEQVG